MTDQNPKHSFLRQLFSFAIVTFLLFLMGSFLVRNWKDIPFGELHFNVLWLALSYLFLFMSFATSGIIWARVLKGLNIRVSIPWAMKSIALSQVGRYVPGHVWSYVGRAELGKKDAIPRITSAVGLFIETELLVVSATLVFLLAYVLAFDQWRAPLPKALIIGLLIIPIEFILIHPRITNTLVSPFFRLFKREAPRVTLNYSMLLQLTLLYAAAWSCCGLGFYFLSKTVYPLSWSICIAVSGAYPAAWLVGFLSFIAPSGLGIREGVLVVLLSPLIPVPMAITLSLLARVWTTLFELVCFLIFLRV